MTKPTRPPLEETPSTETGFASATRDDPRIRLDVSTDGGATFQALPDRSLGETGEYAKRVRWHRCGSGYAVVLRFTVSEAVPFAALDLQVRAR